MGRWELEQIFAPAIDYAENGFPITNLNSRVLRTSADRLSEFPSVRLIRDRTGGAPAPGTRHAFPELAASFREVVRGGKETFYRGALADRIVKGNQEWGGLFTHDDLAEYEAEWQDPISVSYRGYRVHTLGPNSSGFQLLATLKCLEGFEGEDLVFQHPETLHLMAESIKLAATDRIRYAGDPDHVYVPVEGLISEGYATEQRKRIDRGSAAGVSGDHYAREVAADALRPGNPEEYDGGMTTHFAVADRDGNVVSVTQTLGGGFGCGAAVGDTGFFLNNMAFWFDLEEGSPNRIGPSKRVDFVVAPTQTFKDGEFFLSMGTPGGWGILQTTPSVPDERARLWHERSGGDRGSAAPLPAGSRAPHGGAVPSARAPRAGVEGPRSGRFGAVVNVGRRRPGHQGAQGSRRVRGRRGPPSRRRSDRLVAGVSRALTHPSSEPGIRASTRPLGR